jgi:coenzyme F420 hydrogenase subunit beta
MTFFDLDEASRLVFGVAYEDGSDIGTLRDVKASRAQDRSIATAGQGGGTVTSLMVTALNSGLIDSAVLSATPAGENYPRGVLATTVQEVLSCSGSRYVGSHSLAALRDALEQGYQAIGVVGLPCQVRSLRKMALYDLKQENIRERVRLVIGLFCNWAFSSREFTDFLAAEFHSGAVRKFHIPPPPANVLEIETDRGMTGIPLDLLRPMIQDSCSVCGDMTAEFADISVGMYEGRPGWNTLIMRTETGEKLVERALSDGMLEVDRFPEANLRHLRAACANRKKRVPVKSGSPELNAGLDDG